jgi:hypothetical protein
MRLLNTLAALSLFSASSPLTAQTWSPVGEGCTSAVYALEVFNDELYVGGIFQQAGGLNTPNLARWNGGNWAPVANLITFLAADGFYANDTALFIGDAGRVRWWNGSTLSTIPGVFNTALYSMTHFRDTLFAGGAFSSQAGLDYEHVARWTGSAWDSLTSGCNSQVTDLMPFDDQLFVAGNFTMAGDSLFNHVALWNGTAWNRMGNGVNDDVFTHCLFQDTLYIGGRFTQANGQPASRVAKWNGTQWVRVGGTLNDFVTAMKVYRDRLYIGGAFTNPGHIARLDGNTWVAVGGGCNDNVRTMEVYNDTLFVGGSFTTAGGEPASRIAKWYLPELPEVAIGLEEPTICAGQCVNPIDQSTNSPTTWIWGFPGGTPASSTLQAPEVCYPNAGVYPITLTVTNATGFNTTSIDLTVEVCAGLPSLAGPSGGLRVGDSVSGTLRLERTDGSAIGRVRLLDSAGRSFHDGRMNGTVGTLPIADLPAGIYLLLVGEPGGEAVHRFVQLVR